jgi:hypothetical protein
VGDIDPRVGEHLLDVLASEGIAAYLLPATDLHPVTRATTLPARPTDRLYADREHLGTAREHVARLRADENADENTDLAGDSSGPASGSDPVDGVDLDAAWASIVAAYNAGPAGATAPWPEAENISERALDDTDPDLPHRLGLDTGDVYDVDPIDRDSFDRDSFDRDTNRGDRVPDPPAKRSPEEPTLLDALDTFGADLADGDEGYTPPTPPPVPRPSAPVLLALVGIVGGLVLFFKPQLLPIDADVALLVGFGGLLAGVITLIWRLRPGDEEDDSDDDGAIV